MEDLFDISGVFEISKFEIAGLACILIGKECQVVPTTSLIIIFTVHSVDSIGTRISI